MAIHIDESGSLPAGAMSMAGVGSRRIGPLTRDFDVSVALLTPLVEEWLSEAEVLDGVARASSSMRGAMMRWCWKACGIAAPRR